MHQEICTYNYSDGDDYEKQIIGCNGMLDRPISQNETVCYHQSLNDDENFENTEFTGLSLIIKDMEAATIIDRPNTLIEIHDNDSKSLVHTFSLN